MHKRQTYYHVKPFSFSTYRDLIGCLTVNLQVSNHRCSMEGIATLVGKNMFKIFDGKKSTFNGLGCFGKFE